MMGKFPVLTRDVDNSIFLVCHYCGYAISDVQYVYFRYDVGCPRCDNPTLADFSLRLREANDGKINDV